MSKKNRILFLLTNSFTNDSRVLKEGTSLVDAGYEVNLACIFGKNSPEKEIINGIKVSRFDFYNNNGLLANSFSHNKSSINSFPWSRLIYYIKLFLPPIFLIPLGRLKILYYYFKFKFYLYTKYSKYIDIVHCHDLDTLPIGVFFKIFTLGRIKIVYDAHEYETEIGFTIVGIKKIFYQITETICIKFADKVITVSNGIADEYVRLYKIEKPVILFNTPLLAEPQKLDIFRKELGIGKDQIIFIYQGGFIQGRNINLIIDAFKKINSNKVVVFLGDGLLAKEIQKHAKQSNNIFCYKAVHPDILLHYTASAEVGINITDNSCLNHYYCLPNKLFEYTMAKVPSIVSNLFELNKFIKDNGNGIVLEEITADCLKETIEEITPQDIIRLKKATEKTRIKYNWQNEEKKLIKLYDQLK